MPIAPEGDWPWSVPRVAALASVERLAEPLDLLLFSTRSTGAALQRTFLRSDADHTALVVAVPQCGRSSVDVTPEGLPGWMLGRLRRLGVSTAHLVQSAAALLAEGNDRLRADAIRHLPGVLQRFRPKGGVVASRSPGPPAAARGATATAYPEHPFLRPTIGEVWVQQEPLGGKSGVATPSAGAAADGAGASGSGSATKEPPVRRGLPPLLLEVEASLALPRLCMMEVTGDGVGFYPLLTRLRAYNVTRLAASVWLRKARAHPLLRAAVMPRLAEFCQRVRGRPYTLTVGKLMGGLGGPAGGSQSSGGGSPSPVESGSAALQESARVPYASPLRSRDTRHPASVELIRDVVDGTSGGPREGTDAKAFFCTEVMVAALQECGVMSPRALRPARYWPRHLEVGGMLDDHMTPVVTYTEPAVIDLRPNGLHRAVVQSHYRD